MLTTSSQSTVYVRVVVTSELPNGTTVNPTSDTVQFAFIGPYASTGTASSNPPTSTTTYCSGSWDSGTPYTAKCLIGPNGGVTTLTTGAYQVWIKITDNPEVPVLLAGPLLVA